MSDDDHVLLPVEEFERLAAHERNYEILLGFYLDMYRYVIPGGPAALQDMVRKTWEKLGFDEAILQR